jgi:transposase
MRKIPKQASTAAFKEQASKRVMDGKTVASWPRMVEQTLRNWVSESSFTPLACKSTPKT